MDSESGSNLLVRFAFGVILLAIVAAIALLARMGQKLYKAKFKKK
ncbi:MAG TPA: hypothetical protein PL051_03255 [Candidatus Saccharibacteria bacterium]|nr:hypothetical protein [Candidatus Saccharibacteria bacterium]